jgi:spore maturation protein CgeB
MNEFAISEERPIDIFFYGQYIDRYFDKRNELINKLVRLKKENNWNIKISLQYNSFYRTPHFNNKITRALMRYFNIIGFPPADIRRNSVNPYYGLDLYEELSKSKIIFNASADFAQNYQFNMRNIESMGCGAHMLSADGIYPDHFGKGSDFSVYSSFEDFVDKAGYFLNHENVSRQIALQGHKTVSTYYSKDIQWLRFIEIVNNL